MSRCLWFTLIVAPSIALGELIVSDDAAHTVYQDGWTASDNGGVGWGAWAFGVHAAGSVSIASSSTNGGTSTIDTGGFSFRLSDAGNTGNYIDVFRFLSEDLAVGHVFSIDMDVNFRGGFKGIKARSSDDETVLFHFETGNPGTGDDYIVYNVASGGGSIGSGYSNDTYFRIALKQTSATGGTWTINRLGGITKTTSGTYTGQVSSIQLYTVSAGSANEQAILFNNLRVIAPAAVQDNILIDFGRDAPLDGRVTLSPDDEGHYWNNMAAAVSPSAGQTLTNLVTMGNEPTAYSVQIAGAWLANGRRNGGLFAPHGPQRSLLGNLAVETATEDYYFLTGNGVTGTVTFSGLDADAFYHVQLFGSRETTTERITVFATGSRTNNHVTSGTDIGSSGTYDGNDQTFAEFYGIQPNASGELVMHVRVLTGGFGYINALKLSRSPPRSQGRVLIDFGNANRRHALGAADAGGNWWNNVTGNQTVSGLTNAAGDASALSITATGFVAANPPDVFYNDPGGLSPDVNLFGGVFAFTNVAMDALYFQDGFNPSFSISGLDDSNRYNLILYAGRVAGETRVTTFSSGSSSVSLTTSGTGIGSDGSNWNNDRVVTLAGLAPVSGVITVAVTRTQGTFGYLSAMAIESAVGLTLSNSTFLTGYDAITAIDGGLFQLLAAGPNGVIDAPSGENPGAPGGDDYLLDVANNPSYVSAGQLLENMSFSEAFAGLPVYIRFWSDAVPQESSAYGQTDLFILPGLDNEGQAFTQDITPGGVHAAAQYSIPTLSEWGMILLFVLLAWIGGRRLLPNHAAVHGR